MEISSEIRSRIIAAAEQLYQEGGSDRFPTVDQVRRAARADMNTTSIVMKEWRRQQTAAPAIVAVAVPERVQEAMQAALATLWSEAQELANESLAAAKQAWETERADTDALRAELAEAYEHQEGELEATRQQLALMQEQADNEARERERLAQELTESNTRADKAEARLQEIEYRAADLRNELDRSHREADVLRAELAEKQRTADSERNTAREKLAAAQEQLDHMAQELATIRARSEAQQSALEAREQNALAQVQDLSKSLDAARLSQQEAREKAAGLAGQLEVLTRQNKELIEALKKPGSSPKKRPGNKEDEAK